MKQILIERNLINAGAIKAHVAQTIRTLGITDPKITQWFRKRYTDWLQNDYQGVEQLFTADDWNRLMRTPAPDWYTAKIGQEEMLYADLGAAELPEIEGKLAEYLATLIGTPVHNDEQRLLRITVPQALDAWEQQHRQMQRQNQRALKKSAALDGMNDATHVVMEFGDGAFVVEFKTTEEAGTRSKILRQALQAETQMMDGICVGMFSNTTELTGSHGESYAGGIETATKRIFSIRDATGKSHVTVEAAKDYAGRSARNADDEGYAWGIRQVKGPANQVPGPKWTAHIKSLLNALKLPPDHYGTTDIQRLHLNFSEEGRYGSIEDIADPIGEPYGDGSVWYRTGTAQTGVYHLRHKEQSLATVQTQLHHDGNAKEVNQIDGPTPRSKPARSTWDAIKDLIGREKLVVVQDGDKIGMVFVGDIWLDLDAADENFQAIDVPLPKGWAAVCLDIDGRSRLFVLRRGKTAMASLRAEGNRVVKISVMEEGPEIAGHALTMVRHLSLVVMRDGGLLGLPYLGRTFVDFFDPNLQGEPVARPAAGTVVLEIDVGNNTLLYLFRHNREPLCCFMAQPAGGGAHRSVNSAFTVELANGQQTLGTLTDPHRDLINAFLLPRLNTFHMGGTDRGMKSLGWNNIAGLPVAGPIHHPDMPGQIVARSKTLKVLRNDDFSTFVVFFARNDRSRTVASMAVSHNVVVKVAGYDHGDGETADPDPAAIDLFKKLVKEHGFKVRYDRNVFDWTRTGEDYYVDFRDPDLPGQTVAEYGRIEVFEPEVRLDRGITPFLFRRLPKREVAVLMQVGAADSRIWGLDNPGKTDHSPITGDLREAIRSFVTEKQLQFYLGYNRVGLIKLGKAVADPTQVTGEVSDDLGDGWTVRVWDTATPYSGVKSTYGDEKVQTVWIVQHRGENLALMHGDRPHQIKTILLVGGDTLSAALRKKIDAFARLHDFEVTEAGTKHLGYHKIDHEPASYRNASHAIQKGKAETLSRYLLASGGLLDYPMDPAKVAFLKEDHSPEVEAAALAAINAFVKQGGATEQADELGLHRVFNPKFAAAVLNLVDPKHQLLSPDNRKKLLTAVRKLVRRTLSEIDASGEVYGQYKDYYGPLFRTGVVDPTVVRMLKLFDITPENLPWEPRDTFPGLIQNRIASVDYDDIIDPHYDSTDSDAYRLIRPDVVRAGLLTEISNNLEAYLHGNIITEQDFAAAQAALLEALDLAMEKCGLVCFVDEDDKEAFTNFLTWLGQDPEDWMGDKKSDLSGRGLEYVEEGKRGEIDSFELSDDPAVDDKLEELLDQELDALEDQAEEIIRQRHAEDAEAADDDEDPDADDEDDDDDEDFDPRRHPDWDTVLEELKDEFKDSKRAEVEEEITKEKAEEYVSDMVDSAEYQVRHNQFGVLGD